MSERGFGSGSGSGFGGALLGKVCLVSGGLEFFQGTSGGEQGSGGCIENSSKVGFSRSISPHKVRIRELARMSRLKRIVSSSLFLAMNSNKNVTNSKYLKGFS